jgi:RNase P protein component
VISLGIRFSIERTAPRSLFKYIVVVPVRTAAQSVLRHKLKRQVSEAIRRILQKHNAKLGIRLIARVLSSEIHDTKHLENELLSLMKKSDILVL